jgi:hypothetical protein
LGVTLAVVVVVAMMATGEIATPWVVVVVVVVAGLGTVRPRE